MDPPPWECVCVQDYHSWGSSLWLEGNCLSYELPKKRLQLGVSDDQHLVQNGKLIPAMAVLDFVGEVKIAYQCKRDEIHADCYLISACFHAWIVRVAQCPLHVPAT